ncbi:MAG TPA: glycosyltransferase family 2 protein [Pyrinomonadaceae bacterium]|nr:glycosyltransferase family 2 protein [Pyrinomonadaceae bacterium]
MNHRSCSISVFFPAYNDEATIGTLVTDAFAVAGSVTEDYEVIVVNDGSSDRTAEVLDELKEKFTRLKVIEHEQNQGYGMALRSGIRNSEKELIFYTDGDGQYDVREFEALLPLLTADIDVVNGYKRERHDDRVRRLAGAIYNGLARFLFTVPIRDVDCDFRLIRRSALEGISLGTSSGAICVELIHKLAMAGCRFKDVPVNHFPRIHGASQFFTPRSVARTLFDFFRLWWKLVILSKLKSPRYMPTDSKNDSWPDGDTTV